MIARILVVDKAGRNRRLLRRALTGTEWEFEERQSAADVLANMHEFHPHVVVASTELPGVTEMLAAIRAAADAPVIVLTATRKTRERAIQELRAGAHDYIILPQHEEEIRYRLQRAIERKHAADEMHLQLVQTEKMASLGRLVAGVAHEINTPIGAIYSNSDIRFRSMRKLMDLVSASPESPQKKEIDRVLKVLANLAEVDRIACERVRDVVKNLKNFARLDEAERKRVNIHDGLESTLRLVHYQFKGRIRVEKDYGEIPEIDCFPSQLNEVFMNLLVNASEAIDEAGVIRIATRAEPGNVIVTISDTGKGIEADDLSKIFDPGFTTKGAGVGTGLGLSIVYKIVQAHGGTIQAQSEPGKGTRFAINLPINVSSENTRDNAVAELERASRDAA